MCGIAGTATSAAGVAGRDMVASMLDAIAHRGPDGTGLWQETAADGSNIALGHCRLAIIDPDGPGQPLRDSDARVAITFNGEIYNFRQLRNELVRHGYRFRRDSDTEVLLRAYQHWGFDVVNHLRGMFAFAIWDARNQTLFLARDRFGEKPLFFCEQHGNLYFASEIKALLRVPGLERSVDLDAVASYLAYRYVPGPATLFAGIRKLAPGSCAIWRNGQLKQIRYWHPPDRDARQRGSAARFTARAFLERLDDAVATQIVSDVPFGAFLSGGIDSSIVVALMARRLPVVNTFSVGFRESGYSELPFASLVAKKLQTRHHEIRVTHADVIEQLPKSVAMRDAPVSEPSDIPLYLLARAAAGSVKMVLTGEGSDELLAGYPKHAVENIADGYQRLPQSLRDRLIEPLVDALPYRFRRVKTAVSSLTIADRQERLVRWFGSASRAELAQLSRLDVHRQTSAHAPPFDADPGSSSLRRILYFDQASWLPDNLLERTDRMTMAASIEARVPFLDHEFAAFVSTLPDRCRLRGLRGKWILRKAAAHLLPPEILTRPKVGFRVPVNEWFRGPMRDYLREHLQSRASMTREYFQPEALDGVINEHIGGRQNHEKLLWTLLNLEIWHRQYSGNASGPDVSRLAGRAA